MNAAPTVQDFEDYFAGRTTLLERPADPGDFRFEVHTNPEPDDPASLYFVQMIDDRGRVVEAFGCEDPGAAIEAFREHQDYTLEERLGAYGLEWQREQEDRARWS